MNGEAIAKGTLGRWLARRTMAAWFVGASVSGCADDLTPTTTPLDAGAADVDAAKVADAGLNLDSGAPPSDASVQDATIVTSDAATTPDAASADAAWATLPATTEGMVGAGLSDCGPTGSDSCAKSVLVPGGSYGVQGDVATTATLSPYRLDAYEVTVARFRKFFDAWVAGWRPAPGSGKHVHLHGGQGLALRPSGFEPGWDSAWSAWVGTPNGASAPASTLVRDDWNAAAACSGVTGASYASWTASSGAHEAWPMNCVSWIEAHAFCIWDGGFLPSELEWEYAAFGGSELRRYPWGADDPDATRALFATNSLTNVGTKPAGNGRWSHADLAGSVREWVFDVRDPLPVSACTNCAAGGTNGEHAIRSSMFRVAAPLPESALRSGAYTYQRGYATGLRCARTP